MPDETAREAALGSLKNLRMRLLDLTARNRLINFRHTKKGSLRIIDELPNQLVETLLAAIEMRFQSVPEPKEQELIDAGYLEFDEETQELVRLSDDPTAEEWAKYLGFTTSFEVPEPSVFVIDDKHADTAIQTVMYPYEMEARLKNLLSTANSAIQEMGANILYLGFGFLEWYDSNNDSPRIAPLFLVPVRLNKGRLNPANRTYEYTLSYSGEDIIPNLSLREKLKADFAMALPDLDENTVPEDYFDEVQNLIRERQPRWRVRRFISLTLLNFSKLLMYLDLDPEKWPKDSNIIDHPVIKRFLAGYDNDENEDVPDGDFGFGEEYLIDEMEDIHDTYPLIEDADSSQHSALIDAVDGKNLVIEGPPGTGKSQTITNLIAATMAQGKRVLFVAEKLAALEVVRSRLDATGLGEFCLELHSHKSQKRKVLDEVNERLKKHGRYSHPEDIDVEIERYEDLKNQLKKHAKRINSPWKNTGRTLHEIFMAATRYRESIGINPNVLHPAGYDGDIYNPTIHRKNEDQVKAFKNVYKAVENQLDDGSELQIHPWFGVRNSALQIFDLDRVISPLNEWQKSLESLNQKKHFIAKLLDCDLSESPQSLESMNEFLHDLKSLPLLKGNELFDLLPELRGDTLEDAQKFFKFFMDMQSLYSFLANKVDPKVLENLSLADQYIASSRALKSLIGEEIRIVDLAEAINRLTAIQGQLDEFDEPINGIRETLGQSGAEHLSISQAGLREFKTIVELVSELSPSFWKMRDKLFDNDELDEVLPGLRSALKELSLLHAKLEVAYSLDGLPEKAELQKLESRLRAGGFFSWLKSDWRSARKQLMSYAADPKQKISILLPLLGTLAEYSEKHKKLDSNIRYQKLLGDQLRGLDTDIIALELMRRWYKKVRKEYGVGFGRRVSMGDAILDFHPNIVRAIRSLSERGIQQKLNNIFEDLDKLKEVFSPVSDLNNASTILLGSEGIVPRLLSSIQSAVQGCGSLVNNESLTMSELADQIEKIHHLKQAVDKWEKTDFERAYFQNRVDLKLGAKADNATGISILQNTLTIANCVDKEIKNNKLHDYIYNNPGKDSFIALTSLVQELQSVLDEQNNCFNVFEELVQLDSIGWMKQSGNNIDQLVMRNMRALDNGQYLQNWLDYVRVRDQMEALGLSNLANQIEADELKIDQISDAYLAGIYDLLAREILKEVPEIGRFSGRSQEALQEQFSEYDNRLKELQCRKIAWKIDRAKIPPGNGGGRVSTYTDRGLLEHECGLQRPRTPIRQIINRAGRALMAIKPCFMMGPMSVAQYLEPGQFNFDLVVMDEASQIKPQDALGAVARGEQLVVVGDPKQLPPTSFFDRVIDDGEEDPTAIEESESILDATLPLFIARRLRWHYRSQHESLIAFSNHSFYSSDLVLFPSPYKTSANYGIHYSRVKRGCFVNRRNMEEARIISESVREHFRHRPDETLGVVAMSSEQRLQIEGAIETLAKDDPVFQDYLEKDTDKRESLFIKNLENVQGDERDVIYISMTYGPQEPGGNVYQRFGPINTGVGWRRLNVLFTRSKKRMHVFSSMGSNDIVITPASKRGVQALRDFLSYCETGIIHKTDYATGRPPDSDFEVAVMDALREEGFECVPQVGVAGFFIDVTVVDPGNPGRYLMGIECDGATYHSAKSARDRDRLRQTILERLGWNIKRIWSTDWFKNPRAELAPILKELNRLKTEPVAEEAEILQTEQPIEEEIIEDIVDAVEQQEAQMNIFLDVEQDLETSLRKFDQDIIRSEITDTPPGKRLLRPAMIEALLEYTPTSKAEFLELIPAYLRQSTSSEEGEYLVQIFEIINASLENA